MLQVVQFVFVMGPSFAVAKWLQTSRGARFDAVFLRTGNVFVAISFLVLHAIRSTDAMFEDAWRDTAFTLAGVVVTTEALRLGNRRRPFTKKNAPPR